MDEIFNNKHIVELFITLTFTLLAAMHKQAMGKLDAVIKSLNNISIKVEVHSEKLNTGSQEFVKISEHQKEQDATLGDHEKRIIFLESNKNG